MAATIEKNHKKTSQKKRSRGRPPLDSRHPFLNMGKAHKADHGWTVVFATEGLPLNITQEIIDKAVPGVPGRCVVALALAVILGKQYSFQVGTAITKVWDMTAKIELRYKTTGVLARAIPPFDNKQGWNLLPNMYILRPYSRSLLKSTQAGPQRYTAKKKAKEIARKNKGKGATVVVMGRRTPTSKRKRAARTRTVLRNARISWNPPRI